MSGPPYPRYPRGTGSGQNAISQFIIGVSPIGDVTPFDIWQTVVSQYANSPILTKLLTNFGQYFDPTADVDSFFDTIWNVDTAIGYGLDVWGRIVGVSRVVPLQAAPYFGFDSGDGSWSPFGQAPFYSGESLANNYSLSDDAYRTLIFAKALANICDGSIPAINQILLNLFGENGNCWVVDNQDLTMVYKFSFTLSVVQRAIVQSSGVLPRTQGVSVSISEP